MNEQAKKQPYWRPWETPKIGAPPGDIFRAKAEQETDDSLMAKQKKPYWHPGYENDRVNKAIYNCHLDVGEDWDKKSGARLIQAILDQWGFQVEDAQDIAQMVQAMWPKGKESSKNA